MRSTDIITEDMNMNLADLLVKRILKFSEETAKELAISPENFIIDVYVHDDRLMENAVSADWEPMFPDKHIRLKRLGNQSNVMIWKGSK